SCRTHIDSLTHWDHFRGRITPRNSFRHKNGLIYIVWYEHRNEALPDVARGTHNNDNIPHRDRRYFRPVILEEMIVPEFLWGRLHRQAPARLEQGQYSVQIDRWTSRRQPPRGNA